MIVGASGSGKSTFINTLCDAEVLQARDYSDATKAALPKTVEIFATTVEMEEDGTKLSLSIIDTPGFGDSINNEKGFRDILAYIEQQYDDILMEESRIKRNPKFQDNRVHALLYFIQPTGHHLQEMDIEFMRLLGTRVNVLPVLAKADSFTPAEVAAFKRRVMEDVRAHGIPIFSFEYDAEEDDEETVEENKALQGMLPFAVIGAQDTVFSDGRKVRCRQYPWGLVEVDNPKHCDFAKLRYTLLISHLDELKDVTHDVLYERYRTEKLLKDGSAILSASQSELQALASANSSSAALAQ